MKYACQSVDISRILVDETGVVHPICNSCKSKDCSNPIELRKMSIFGETRDVKLLNRNGVLRAVISCEGYLT